MSTTTVDPAAHIRLATFWLKSQGMADTYGEVAEAMGTSESYLAKIRKKEKGVSPEKADEWLSNLAGHYSVTREQMLGISEGESATVEDAPPPSEDKGVADETKAQVPIVEESEPPLVADDQVALKHGDLFFIANREEGGLWHVEANLRDDEAIRLIAMSLYREMFGGWTSSNGDNEEGPE